MCVVAQLSRPTYHDRKLWGWLDEPALCVASGDYSNHDQCRIVLRARKFRIHSFSLQAGDYLQWVNRVESVAAYHTCDSGVCGGDWTSSMDAKGWSTCHQGCAVTGLRRIDGQHSLDDIDGAKCCQVGLSAHCEEKDIGHTFDREGWATCPDNTYLAGLYRSEGENAGIGLIEKLNCCGDPGLTLTNCERLDMVLTFDSAGFAKCPEGKVANGLWRSGERHDDRITALEYLSCCDVRNAKVARKEGFMNWQELNDDAKAVQNVHEGTEVREQRARLEPRHPACERLTSANRLVGGRCTFSRTGP